MRLLEVKTRPFACDKCGAMHERETNHKGKIYNQKCDNWPCTAGCFDYTSMTYWGGKTVLKTTRFYRNAGDKKKVRMYFKKEANMDKIKVGVHDNSTDWGIIGKATTERGAIRIGRRWAREHSTQTGYAGYGPIITLHYADGQTDQHRAW